MIDLGSRYVVLKPGRWGGACGLGRLTFGINDDEVSVKNYESDAM